MANSLQSGLSISYSIRLLIILICLPACLCGQHGLLAEYYDGRDFNRFVSSEYVKNIEAYWDATPPVAGIDPHLCSIRWTGKLQTGQTADYVFSAMVDDGIKVWIDGELIIDQWNLNDVGRFNGMKTLVANQAYDIKVDYFNALREGEIKLMWAIQKPTEDQSWYEYFMGVEYTYETIPMGVFFRPPAPIEDIVEEVVEQKPTPPPAKKIQKKTPPREPIAQAPIEPKQKVPPVIVKQEVMTQAKAEKYIPKNVQFGISKAEVLPSSFDELNTFATFMKENPDVRVTIEGHTDVAGDQQKNQELSENRAKTIASFLVEKGIDRNRITTVGYGGSRPLKVPTEGEYYPPNRRVAFILSGLGG